MLSEDGPKAIGPYSPAIKVANLIFVSGQLPIDPIQGEITKENVEEQARQALDNLKTVLQPYAIGLENIVKTTVFLKDMSHFSRVNKIYGEYFISQFPARSCVEVTRLPKDAKIEIEAVAFIE